MIHKLTSPTAQAVGFILGALIISLATLTPADSLPLAPGSDKLHHLLGFGGWALLCAFGPMKRFVSMSLLIIAWGGAIELIQPHLNRYGEWLDFYANTSGVVVIVLAKCLLRHLSKRLV
ncbi:hypothetical protein HGG82_00020 [Marinomonas sp. M1K-6]|uniref:VanZ-like domain-containing protein n=1 Tax=Marinomonas profundi TaxID=2726122 RepID=A0A847R586_9GAMM|nr:hypothetical protein [Marinomonas profundi]NLQ16004.1 hypothetical protein [Marinomonas profundi]UDV03402.1 hypothetical protein J8N69_00980 [Marinomonas profundi]